MSHAIDQLWSVAGGTPHVDADALASAVEAAAQTGETLDYRTRLLIRDSVRALESHWGSDQFTNWLSRSPVRDRIEQSSDPNSFDHDPAEIGFPSLTRRVVDATKPEIILEFFRTLSSHVRQPTRLIVGGSISLMLNGLLSRRTEDVDVVDEVPAELRRQHEALEQLATRFGLQLAHFQSHYLPSGWERRIHSFQIFDQLDVHLVDPYDVLVSKLCSRRAKDLDDFRALKPHLDRNLLTARLTEAGAALLAEVPLREAAKQNWYVLFGDELPA
ncbi:MAG: DUF6036 family nucleotidyltransferase [Tepidisphaeraceae bacterium]